MIIGSAGARERRVENLVMGAVYELGARLAASASASSKRVSPELSLCRIQVR
jgi:hypothetical protein